MTSGEIFEAYRRMFATGEDGEVCWWYSGWTFVSIDGYPDIPLSQVVAVMTYRTRTFPDGRFEVDWSEIGVFRDPATGELPEKWINPITGQVIELPRSFSEGPGSYVVAPAADTVQLELTQPNARLLELRVDFHPGPERCWFRQLERKVRGFPRPDGSLPPPGSSSGFESVTELAFHADRRAIQSGGAVPTQGTYSFRLAGIPPWMGFGPLTGVTTTRGCITKARPGEILDREAWARLQTIFPGSE